MHVLVIYCHPSEDSFTAKVRDEFIRGLEDARHTYAISDLYKMNFSTEISEEEYIRESYYLYNREVSGEVKCEHRKIQRADAIVFIYPLFWSDVPAKLKGWFDRVYSVGYAYGSQNNQSIMMKHMKKVLCIVTAGNSKEELEKRGIINSLKNVMLGDRIGERADEKELIILDGMSRDHMPARRGNWNRHLKKVYEAAMNLDS